MTESTGAPLHPLEEKVLAGLLSRPRSEFGSIVSTTGLHPDQVRRALSWLSSKQLVTVDESSVPTITVVSQPPELLLLEKLRAGGGHLPMAELRGAFASQQEYTAAVGRASSAGWISITSGTAGPVVQLKDQKGAEGLRAALKTIGAGVEESAIPSQERQAVADLLKRGLLKRSETKTVSVGITAEGKRTLSSQKKESYAERLTPDIIASIRSSGVDVKLRPIDVTAPATGFFPGRRHPVREFINEVREAYLSMGFTEIVGDAIQSSFWNFDALFTPQDHPARELQDTFYVKGARDANLSRAGVVANVASAHEDGWKTGSMGWGYKWDIEEARRLVLRTHNTALTIRATMDSKDEETRVFSVGKVYRNESIDYKHLAEFHQMEGIVVGEGLNVRDLMGVLKRFYKKLGMENVKFWPSYFPYTEPSVQVMYHDEKLDRWIEMGGSGLFRPEVALPLGVRKTVLAWGLGLERVLALRMGLEGIRGFYENDLDWLRRRKEIAGSKDIL